MTATRFDRARDRIVVEAVVVEPLGPVSLALPVDTGSTETSRPATGSTASSA